MAEKVKQPKVPQPVQHSNKQRKREAGAIFQQYWAEQRLAPKRRQWANRMKAKARNEQIVIRRLQKIAAKKAEPAEEVELEAA